MFCSVTIAAPISYTELLSRKAPIANKRIAYGTQPDQFGELWIPDTPGLHPVVVMIHGGCWLEALPGVKLMAYISEDLREHGIAVWNIEYRRLTNNNTGYPDTFRDIASGIDYLKILHNVYGLDTSHVIVLGHSAGGQLALWAAGRNDIKQGNRLYFPDPQSVSLVISLAGIDDLQAYHDSGYGACGGPAIIERLIDSKARYNPYADTSPAAMLPLSVKQVIVSGTLDNIVPPRFGNAYASHAKAVGDNVQSIVLSNTGHFELIDPQSGAWQKIRAIILSNLTGYSSSKDLPKK